MLCSHLVYSLVGAGKIKRSKYKYSYKVIRNKIYISFGELAFFKWGCRENLSDKEIFEKATKGNEETI